MTDKYKPSMRLFLTFSTSLAFLFPSNMIRRGKTQRVCIDERIIAIYCAVVTRFEKHAKES